MKKKITLNQNTLPSSPATRGGSRKKENADVLAKLCEEYFEVGLNTKVADSQPPAKEIPIPEEIKLKDYVTVGSETANTLLYDMDILEYEGETLICLIHQNKILLYMLDEFQVPFKTSEYVIKVANTKAPEAPRQPELFHVCKFGYQFPNKNSNESEIIIATAGTGGYIYLMNLNDENCSYLQGHVSEIYDLCLGPWRYDSKYKNLILSCSRDGSVGLWNYKSRVQIASYKSGKAPILDSISIDWHVTGVEFLQTCIDGSVSVWELGDIDNLINLAQNWTRVHFEFPRKDVLKYKYRTFDMHENYVDCALYLGDMIVSKDVDGKFAMWINSGVENEIICFSKIVNRTYESVWSLRMHISSKLGTIVYGNDTGRVYMVKLSDESMPQAPRYRFHTNTSSVIRKAMLNEEGTMLFVLADGGKLWYHKLSESMLQDLKSVKWTLHDNI